MKFLLILTYGSFLFWNNWWRFTCTPCKRNSQVLLSSATAYICNDELKEISLHDHWYAVHVNELVVDPSMVLVLVLLLLLLLGWGQKGAGFFNFRLYLNIGCHFVFGINKVREWFPLKRHHTNTATKTWLSYGSLHFRASKGEVYKLR